MNQKLTIPVEIEQTIYRLRINDPEHRDLINCILPIYQGWHQKNELITKLYKDCWAVIFSHCIDNNVVTCHNNIISMQSIITQTSNYIKKIRDNHLEKTHEVIRSINKSIRHQPGNKEVEQLLYQKLDRHLDKHGKIPSIQLCQTLWNYSLPALDELNPTNIETQRFFHQIRHHALTYSLLRHTDYWLTNKYALKAIATESKNPLAQFLCAILYHCNTCKASTPQNTHHTIDKLLSNPQNHAQLKQLILTLKEIPSLDQKVKTSELDLATTYMDNKHKALTIINNKTEKSYRALTNSNHSHPASDQTTLALNTLNHTHNKALKLLLKHNPVTPKEPNTQTSQLPTSTDFLHNHKTVLFKAHAQLAKSKQTPPPITQSPISDNLKVQPTKPTEPNTILSLFKPLTQATIKATSINNCIDYKPQ